MFGVIEILILLLSLLTIIIVKTFTSVPDRPILNVYQRQPNFYWFKVSFMYTILSLRRLTRFLKNLVNAGISTEKFERSQKLSFHNKAIDAVYFNGAGSNGDFLVTGMARRPKKLIDGFLYLKIVSSGLGLLESPKLPSTSLYQTEEAEEHCAEGITITPVTPMKKWKITYSGKMKKADDFNQIFDVHIDAEWSSNLPYFNFDTDMDDLATAKAMALETWSKEYFDTVKRIHQTHYEQHGDLKGTVTINSKSYQIDVNTMRDHSFGLYRDWKYFHRYGLHFFAAENGDRFTVGIVSMPLAFSCLPLGYIYCAKENQMHAVQSCDLQLYQHGEDGNPPLDYAFSFMAGNKNYTVQVNVIDSPAFYISEEWESKVIERLCTFTINGVKGWGSAEWEYLNIEGKNVTQK